MSFDWAGLEAFVTEEIIAAVRSVRRMSADTPVCRAAVTDFYTQKMLVLWPTIAVSTDRYGWRPAHWQWQFDADKPGDEWAARVTAYAGSPGHRWSEVIDRFFDTIVNACRTASISLRDEGGVDNDFVAVAVDDDVDLITRCLTGPQLATHFPLIHRRDSVIRALREQPMDRQIELLLAGLASANRESELDVADCVRLLTALGEPAAVAAAETICAGGGPVAEAVRVIDGVGAASAPLVATLAAAVHDPSLRPDIRDQLACSLARLGRLDVVIDAGATLSEDAMAAAVADVYLSDHKNGPLDYAPLEAAFDAVPALHDRLFARVSPNHMFAIDADDLATAMTALSSRWPMVRRHAAIVMLSVHL